MLLGTEALGASTKEVRDDSGKKHAFTVCSLKFSLPSHGPTKNKLGGN